MLAGCSGHPSFPPRRSQAGHRLALSSYCLLRFRPWHAAPHAHTAVPASMSTTMFKMLLFVACVVLCQCTRWVATELPQDAFAICMHRRFALLEYGMLASSSWRCGCLRWGLSIGERVYCARLTQYSAASAVLQSNGRPAAVSADTYTTTGWQSSSAPLSRHVALLTDTWRRRDYTCVCDSDLHAHARML